MSEAFDGCTALIQAPSIPSGVKYMSDTFAYCTALTQAPVIPAGVTKMNRLFYNCHRLTGAVTIHANPAEYSNCFYQTVQPITLSGSSTVLNELAETNATKGNVTVEG
jgi:hypothetical protein